MILRREQGKRKFRGYYFFSFLEREGEQRDRGRFDSPRLGQMMGRELGVWVTVTPRKEDKKSWIGSLRFGFGRWSLLWLDPGEGRRRGADSDGKG